MLNFPILVGVILSVVACSLAYHTRAQERALHSSYDTCSEDLGIPLKEHYFERGFHGGLTADDPNAIPFIFCVMLRMDFVDCAGTINQQEVLDFFTDGHDITSLPGVIDECDKNKSGKTNAERSFSFYRCFFEQKKFVI
uniref:Putative odorant-binding protein 56a n=1 Tax=Culex tarsalis TaxID=7177 RepID=A0A1Q3FTH2_CULTA